MPVVIAVLGGVCVLAGVFGGMAGNIILPTLSDKGRWGAGFLGIVLLAIGSGMWLFPQMQKPASPAEARTPSRTVSSQKAATPETPSPAARASITYPPHDGVPGAPAAVSQTRGLVVRGGAQGIGGGEHLWLFDFDPEDNRLYEVSEAPIAVTNGVWDKQDGPIGDPGVKKIQYVVVIRANDPCNTELKSQVAAARKNNTEPFSLDAPPDGCVEDDRAPVNISLP